MLPSAAVALTCRLRCRTRPMSGYMPTSSGQYPVPFNYFFYNAGGNLVLYVKHETELQTGMAYGCLLSDGDVYQFEIPASRVVFFYIMNVSIGILLQCRQEF
jgi:hypothetical protein